MSDVGTGTTKVSADTPVCGKNPDEVSKMESGERRAISVRDAENLSRGENGVVYAHGL